MVQDVGGLSYGQSADIPKDNRKDRGVIPVLCLPIQKIPSKAEADRKRTAYATKRKAELAFDQMEADLLAQVRQYPDLVDQLKDVLTQARARIANTDTE